MDAEPIMTKIFGLGLPKTGTVSLAQALTTMGYNTIHNPWKFHHQILMDANFRWDAEPWDALVHFGYHHFRQLNREYPGSKWILTIRDVGEWLDSCERWFSTRKDCKTTLNRIATFGTAIFHREHFRDVYMGHLRNITGYFRNLSNFIMLPVGAKDTAEILSGFLGRPLAEYPHANKHEDSLNG
jgi:hypothetical protein